MIEKVYLAAAYERQAQMREYRDRLAPFYEVTSRWIDQDEGSSNGLGKDDLREDPSRGTPYALLDIEDIGAADTVISFTEGGGRGGRHVEFGIALATGKRLIIVGPREHVFHCYPGVHQYPDFISLYYNLTIGAES